MRFTEFILYPSIRKMEQAPLTWKVIPGFERYEVNECGEIRNKRSGIVRIMDRNAGGYARFRISVDNKYKRLMVHRAVALAFIPNPQNKKCVDHIDNNKLNNHVSNLRWATVSENALNTKIRANTVFKNVVKSGKKFYWRVTINFQTHRSETFETAKEAFEDFTAKIRTLSEFASIQSRTIA